MILRAIEEWYQRQNPKAEPIIQFNFDRLEVEHIMPQAWEANWPIDEAATSREDRNWRLQGVGNLTLVSAPLNKDASNGPWVIDSPDGKSKRNGLEKHSKLELNSRLIREHPDTWNEKAIGLRAIELFEAARRIWPV